MLSKQSLFTVKRSMGKKSVVVVTGMLMLLSTIIVSAAPIDKVILTGPVHNIDTDEYFNEIQAAIDDPDTLNGHTIEVAAGTFYEYVIISKSLTINGAGIDLTIINAQHLKTCFQPTIPNPPQFFSIQNFTIVDGGWTSHSVGGGIKLWGVDFTIKNCKILDCDAVAGGAICVEEGSKGSIENCVIYDNTANNNGGGLFVVGGSNLTLVNSVIYSNIASNAVPVTWGYGGGLYGAQLSDIYIRNCIFWNNYNLYTLNLDQIYLSGQQPPDKVSVNYTDIQDGFIGIGNIDSDPLFVNPSTGDFHLQSISPCIDAGDPSDPVPPGGGSRIDMGAYESQSPSGPVHNIDTDEYFNEIQAAIDDPDTLNGHTIEVATGTYYEYIVVNKQLTLMGENKETTIIDGGHVGDVVNITSDWVTISGFTITNSGNNTSDAGIELGEAKNCIVQDNIIADSNKGVKISHPQSQAGNFIYITDNDYRDQEPKINNNEQIVWVGRVWAGRQSTRDDIFFWDGKTTIQITDDTSDERNPQINDRGDLAWQASYDVFYWDGNTTIKLTNYDDDQPKMNNNGHITWRKGYRSGEDYEICYWDGKTIYQLTDNEWNDWRQEINDNDEIVWMGYDGNDNEIFYWNGSTITQITDNNYNDYDPEINNNGEVAWHTDPGFNIMFWNGTKITQIAGGDEGGWNLQINDLGGVVWEGYLAKPGGPEILYWDGSDIIQLTNNDYRDYKPQTNANGHVVWGGYELGSPDLFYWDTNTVTRLTSNSDIGDPHINDNNNIVFMDGYGPDYDIVYWENYGISLYNTIKDNTIINNAMGIYVDNGENNIIYHNNLIDNTVQARDDENNFWDDGYPSGGNYWSNYIGQDYYSGPNQDIPGSDGIGDTSYIIDFDSQDNYPLMAPSVWMTDLYISDEDISLSNSNPYKWEEVTIYAQVHSIGFVETACTVSFYLDSVAPDNLIYREYEVLVPSHGNTTVFHDWVADVSGNHTIIVDITNSNPPETDLTNNTASKDIYIIPPCGKLKVKACSDKQKYIIGVDDHAEIIVKVTCQGEIIEGAAVSAWVIDPNEANSSVAVTEVSPGIYTGSYFFTNASIPGTYRIKAVASKAGYLNGENDDSKDKFFLDSPAANIPEVVSVALSDQLLMQGADVIVMANVNNNAEVSSIFAEVRRHGSKPVFALPLFDDGSHSDAVPNDGIYTYSFPSDDMSGTFTVDIYLNGRNFENRNVLVVNPEDMIAMETITGLHSSTNVLYLVSTQTNTTLNVTTAVDIADVSFTIVEHRTASEGKNIEIIASANIQTVLEIVCIEISYIESDIPDGINETDMQLYCWNPYSEELVPCEPSGVNPNDDIVWGDVDHFSLFVMKKSILRYDIFLDVGWNLISVPLIQTDTSISTVLSSIEGKWDVAQYYDATCTNDPWKTYIAYRPASLNTLLNLNHKNAFWLHTTEQCRLTIYGQASTSTAISLYAGWNLVGYPSMNQKSISDALAGTGYDSIEGFSASDPYHTGVLPDSYLMRPGEGYWVHVLADSVWIVDW